MFKYFIIAILLILFFPSISFSQKLKYKEIIEIINTQSKDLSYAMLKEYQKFDTTNVNSYYQLALIAQYWAETFDPLAQYEDVEYFTTNALMLYKKTLDLLDDKEVKQNREYYSNIAIGSEKKIEYYDVVQDINSRIDKLQFHQEKISEIVYYFNSAVNHYNTCRSAFVDVNNSRHLINDIYLSNNDTQKLQLNTIILSFDSCEYYFSKYKEAIKSYPINNHSQNYTLRTIENYQLDGLSFSSFMKNTIELWDYKTWVLHVQKTIEEKIDPLRIEIETVYKQYTSFFNQFENANDPLKLEPVSLNNEIKLKINIYDQNSLIISLFEYYNEKILYLLKNKAIEKMSDSILSDDFTKKVKMYNELLTIKKSLDSTTRSLENYKNQQDLDKYYLFIKTYYNNSEGFKNYVQEEEKKNVNYLNVSKDNLKTAMFKAMYCDTSKYIAYKKGSIPLYISAPEFVGISANKKEKYITTEIYEIKSGEAYLTGTYISIQNKINTFVAKTDASKKNILWLKTFSPEKSNQSRGVLLCTAGDTCMLVATSEINGQLNNTFYKFDKHGNEIIKRVLESKKIPRIMKYDEINNRLIIAFKGELFNAFSTNSEVLTVYYLAGDAKPVWQYTFEFTGNIVDIVKSEDRFMLILNFIKYADLQSKTISSLVADAKNSNICCVILDGDGTTSNITNFLSSNALIGYKTFKINSETICIAGLKADYSINKDFTKPFLFMLIDSNGNIVFPNY